MKHFKLCILFLCLLSSTLAFCIPHNSEQTDSENCPICFCELLLNEQIKKLECGHSLHGDCFMRYVVHQRNNNQPLLCMVCRRSINEEPDQVLEAEEPTVQSAQSTQEDSECILCQGFFLPSETRMLSCGHSNFHAECLDGWFARQACYGECSCPVCDAEVN